MQFYKNNFYVKNLTLILLSISLLLACSDDSQNVNQPINAENVRLKVISSNEEIGNDGEKRILTFSYDAEGNLTSFFVLVEEKDGTKEESQYNLQYNDGRVVGMISSELVYSFAYNSESQVSIVKLEVDNIILKYELEYNSNGDVLIAKYFVNSEAAATINYNIVNGNLTRTETIRSNFSELYNYTYDTNPNVFSATGLNKGVLFTIVGEEFAFSKNNPLTTVEKEVDGDNLTYKYTYRDDGLPLSQVEEGIFDAEQIKTVFTFTYE